MVLLDAGSAASELSLEAQALLQDVLLSHAHMDHVADLCFVLDNTLGKREGPLRLWCLKETAKALEEHLFNGRLWPNVLSRDIGGSPLLEMRRLSPGERVRVADLEVTAHPVHHAVPTAGFLLEGPGGSLLYTADTAPTEAIWDAAEGVPDLRAIITEASFPNRMEEIARLAGHLTPALLKEELRKMPPEVPVYLYHAKPAYAEELKKEVEALGEPRVRWLKQGKTYDFGA
ncbi:MAG: 3',5'-cyclic-nucleotide phosphodiesterase [Candidatus Tectomicrobia bacterium]|nr:3',5'-cyclic-nucleotide phosphodiesterase [Candidatus Tectomicrobia bacterium]